MCLVLAACSSAREAQQKTAERQAVRRDVVHEVERICALPEPERTEELKKVTAEAGYALVCAQP